MIVRALDDDEWSVLEWLWQAYSHDLSEFRDAYPRPDGRFNHAWLDREREAGTAYVVWHDPGQGFGESPVGFSLVSAGERGEWHMQAFFVARVARRSGTGRILALETIRRHPGLWAIAFQEENPRAARFWRGLADEAFPAGWREERRQNPAKPDIPPDVWILGG